MLLNGKNDYRVASLDNQNLFFTVIYNYICQKSKIQNYHLEFQYDSLKAIQ